jgi:GAF domain-containing protein
LNTRFVAQLIDLSSLIQQHGTLEDGIRQIAELAAQTLGVGRCSVMLTTRADGAQTPQLRVVSHFGDLPSAAYETSFSLHSGLAGLTVSSGDVLLVNNIETSAFASLARNGADARGNLMCAPIRVADRIIGVINVSQPEPDRPFDEQDLELLKVFSLFLGQAIHVFQLQRLSESRLLQMAEVLNTRSEQASTGPISPDPSRLAKVVAKNFYRELSLAGFGANAIITVASEVLGLLNENLAKHRSRLKR